MMNRFKSICISITAAMALIILTGCEQIEQVKTDTLEKAKQSASRMLNEAGQSPSIEQAKESANQVLIESKKAAADLLDQASQYLDQQSKIIENSSEQESSPGI